MPNKKADHKDLPFRILTHDRMFNAIMNKTDQRFFISSICALTFSS